MVFRAKIVSAGSTTNYLQVSSFSSSLRTRARLQLAYDARPRHGISWHNPIPMPPSRHAWQAAMSLALVYNSAGTEKQTQWFDCTVDFEGYTVTSMRRRE